MVNKKDGPVIELRNVWKNYHIGQQVEVHALRGMNLKIYSDDFIVVLGQSGSGKSTLMNMIGALDIPSKGEVYLDGKDIAKMDESALAQLRGKKIGFVFQQFNLVPVLDAIGNVSLPMIFQGIPEEERTKRAIELLKLVKLESRMNHRPTEMSGGEQQRVAIARALANNPEIILADEPTGNLDSKTGIEIMNILDELHHKKGKTILLVTHDTDLIKYAHRTIHIKDGQVFKDGRRD